MPIAKDTQFLYSRFVLLGALIGAVGSAFAGLKGFPFWYGGFVLCFWIVFGLINHGKKSSLHYLLKKPLAFVLFFGALTAVSFFADRFGLTHHLWFYPSYRGAGFLWVYLVLYPFAALSVLELIYFLASFFGEKLQFRERPMTKWHGFFDVLESILFLSLIGMAVAGALGWGGKSDVEWVTALSVLWLLAACVKLRFHIRHPGHYMLVLFLAGALALFLNEFPNTAAREWIYLNAPLLTTSLVGFPVWLLIAWYLLTFVPLRLWIFLVLHPKVK